MFKFVALLVFCVAVANATLTVKTYSDSDCTNHIGLFLVSYIQIISKLYFFYLIE